MDPSRPSDFLSTLYSAFSDHIQTAKNIKFGLHKRMFNFEKILDLVKYLFSNPQEQPNIEDFIIELLKELKKQEIHGFLSIKVLKSFTASLAYQPLAHFDMAVFGLLDFKILSALLELCNLKLISEE